MTSKTSSDDVFEYTGKGQFVPKDVVSVRFHPNVIEVKDCRHFADSKSLKEIALNEGLQDIGSYAFMNCTALQSIKLPSTLTEIGDYAFYNCASLRVLVLNDGLKEIGENAFYGCLSLESITLPSTLIDIGDIAFCGCSNLQEVVIMNEKTKICNNTFMCCAALERYKTPNLVTRFEALLRVGYTDIVNKINNLPGVHCQITIQTPRRRKQQHNRRVGEIIIPAHRISTVVRPGYNPEMQKVPYAWVTIKPKLDTVAELIACYEKKEATTLLQLAFWKANMSQSIDHPINREAYRIEVPGPAKDTIMQLLQGVEKEPELSPSRRRPARSAASIFPSLDPLF